MLTSLYFVCSGGNCCLCCLYYYIHTYIHFILYLPTDSKLSLMSIFLYLCLLLFHSLHVTSWYVIMSIVLEFLDYWLLIFVPFVLTAGKLLYFALMFTTISSIAFEQAVSCYVYSWHPLSYSCCFWFLIGCKLLYPSCWYLFIHADHSFISCVPIGGKLSCLWCWWHLCLLLCHSLCAKMASCCPCAVHVITFMLPIVSFPYRQWVSVFVLLVYLHLC